MLVWEEQDPERFRELSERNLLRQYDLLTSFIQIGLGQSPQSFDKYMLWALNAAAVAGICQFGGRFRQEPIYVGNHTPPDFRDVPELMDRFVATVQENWFVWSPTEVAAYGLWRLLWIHPFIEGNGRTARACCYYLLSARAGAILPGKTALPDRIRANREPYYAALRKADAAWEQGNLDFSELEAYLAGLVQAQLSEP